MLSSRDWRRSERTCLILGFIDYLLQLIPLLLRRERLDLPTFAELAHVVRVWKKLQERLPSIFRRETILVLNDDLLEFGSQKIQCHAAELLSNTRTPCKGGFAYWIPGGSGFAPCRTFTFFFISFPPCITVKLPTNARRCSSVSSIASLSEIHKWIPRRPE